MEKETITGWFGDLRVASRLIVDDVPLMRFDFITVTSGMHWNSLQWNVKQLGSPSNRVLVSQGRAQQVRVKMESAIDRCIGVATAVMQASFQTGVISIFISKSHLRS